MSLGVGFVQQLQVVVELVTRVMSLPAVIEPFLVVWWSQMIVAP